MAGGPPRRQSSQQGPKGHAAPWPSPVETVVRNPIGSRIEAKRRCLKAFGERIPLHDPDRKTAEVQIRSALMNC